MSTHSPLTAAAEAQLTTLKAEQPSLAAALSDLGRRLVFPQDIPAQSAEARGKRFNATIGQITDGHGHALPLPSMAAVVSGMSQAWQDRAFLYSPVEGIPAVREAWRSWQRRDVADVVPSSLPVVTVGLTHGLSLVADLFGGPGRAVVIPAPYWGNYNQTFATRTGARVISTPAYKDGVYHTRAIAEALEGLPDDEPAVAILNLPSNPSGYSLTGDERRQVHESLVEAAGRRPLVVLVDDAYAGLVYDDAVPRASMFWDLVGAHPNLIPVKVDGATKELSFFGGRVGFVTFPYDRGSAAALILEDKVKCLTRATMGSPVAFSQMMVLEALTHDRLAPAVEEVRQILAERAAALAIALEGIDHRILRPIPFNSGCFALVQLAPDLGLTSEQVRKHLLAHQDTGLVSIKPDYVRIAFCSVDKAHIPALVERLEAGVKELR